MEIRKDQHQEMFTPSFREDYKDDDDEEDNRFIISLDDVEMIDDSLDEGEKSSEEPEEKAGNSQVLSDALSLHRQSDASSLCATSDGIQFEDNILKTKSLKSHSEAGNVHQPNFSVIDCNGDDTSCTAGGCHLSSRSMSRENDKTEFSHLNSEHGSVEQSSNKKLVERKDELRNGIGQHSVALYSQAQQLLDRQNKSSTSETLCTETVSKPKGQFTKFARHKDCSCIMCYQGRGIIDSNWIPTAAKRKVEVSSIDHCPAKTMRVTPSNIPGNLEILLSSQITSKSPSSTTPKVSTVSSVRPVAESLVSRSHMSKDVSLSNTSNLPSLMRASTMSSNFVLIVPHTSSASSEKKTDAQGTTREQHQMYSNSPRTASSTPLLVLTPMPHVRSSMPNPISASLSSSSSPSPTVTNLSSQVNFSLMSQTSSVATAPKTQVSTSQSDKTHVVLIDKMSAEKQLTGLSDILKRATKVDMSESGVVHVHFKPLSSQDPLSKGSQKSPVSIMSQLGPHVSQSRFAPHASEKCLENTLMGLVKNHLVNQSSSTMKEAPLGQNVSMPSIAKMSTQSSPRKPSLHPKPSLSYCLVSKNFIPGKLASVGSSGPLPPPPPLTPRPGAVLCSKSRPTKYQAVEVIDLEEEQTETMVLPLPNHDQQKSSGEESSLNLSQQDERLLSPSLFTFSSPLELSPQKSTSQYSSSFQNQMHSDSPSASLISSSSQSILNSKSSPIISSALSSTPVTTLSFAVSRQNSIHCTSAWSDSPQIVSQASSNSNVSPRQENHVTSEWHQPSSSKLVQIQSRTSDLFKPSAHSSTMSTSPQPSVSIVSNATGLKMKIRLKDSKSECTNTSSKERQSNIVQSQLSNDTAEVRKNNSIIPGGLSSSQGHSSVAMDNTLDTTACSNESNLARPPTLSSRIETAEEMFKRFQDQAMREVYNAQFGVGEIQRSLRPVRTPFANGDDPFPQSKNIDESKIKKGDADKAKPNQIDFNQAGNTYDIGKKVVRNKRKRALSGEARQRIPVPSEKSMKLDINQFPKLMQDNSIVNRKTIFTPNILVGHKVYVKFNVFSNSQSGRSFLVPFFNIGGSRTQFDVEDVEYFNKAVVEFEKDERSCARHLLYYSREGQKATFLRKENALHSNELSAKSYKKHSYILQGYTREKPKKPASPTDEWKLDRIVAIEIDRAEQDCEVELSHAHKPVGTGIGQTKSESNGMSPKDCANALDKIVHKHSSEFNDNSPSPVTASPQKDLSTRGPRTNFSPTSPSLSGLNSFQFAKHRDRVNILKRNTKIRKSPVNSISSPPSVETSPSEPKSSHIKQLEELIGKGNVEETISLTTSHMRHQTSVCNEQISVSKELAADEGSKHNTDIPHIKTEVPDDGYDSALMVKENMEPPPLQEILGISIKSEPIDDYTESLAQSMSVSLQKDKQTCLNSLESSNGQDHDEYSQHKSDNYPTRETQASNSSKIMSSKDDCLTTANIGTEHSITPSDITGPLSSTVAVIKSVSPKKDFDASSKVCAEAHPPCGIESKTRKSPELESLSVSESNEVTSLSEVETSSSDEETDKGALSTPIINNGCTNVPPANNKITSLVESLKQRLVEANSSFPSLFPSDQQRIKKTKKKKKKITCMTGLNSKENSLHNTSAPVNESHSLSPHSSKNTSGSGATSEFGNVISNSEIDITPDLASSMRLSTSSLLSTSPKLSLTNSPIPSSQLDLMVDKPMLPKSRTEMDDFVTKDSRSGSLSSSSLACTNVKSVGETVSQSSKVLLKETFKLHDNQGKDNECKDITKPELYQVSGVDEEIHQLTKVLDGTKWTERKVSGKDKLLLSSKSEKEGINQHSENTQDNTRCKQTKEADFALDQGVNSNRSTPCSEIDVGTDEVAFEISDEVPTTQLGPLLTSPPVPTTGRVSIKDFTREYDLMVPYEPKPHLKNDKPRNVERKKSITAGSSFNKKEGNANKIATSYPTVASNTKETSHHQADFKPSIASLLCDKLAIDTDPVTPTPIVKKVKAVPQPVTASRSPRKKLIASQEQSTSYPVSSSFYKPTLSAIFGVENVSVPPVDEKKPEEKEKEWPSAASQGKRRRQVALKGVHNRKKTVGKLVLQRVKTKNSHKQNAQDQKRKMNISLKTKIQLRDNIKAASPRVTSQSQAVSLQRVFRTWRQLSHEEKSKQQEFFYSDNISTIPCKVVLQKLRLDSNGQPIKSKLDEAKEAAAESIQDKDKKSVISRKKRKRAAGKGQRRRRNPREKKDIVDYYASIIENLRRKAQMLEDEEMKKQQEKLENEIKIEPIAFERESSSLISHAEHDNVIDNVAIKKYPFTSQGGLEDAKFCSKDIQIVNDGAKMKMSPTENQTKLMETDKNRGSLERGSHNTDSSSPSNLLPIHTALKSTHVNKVCESKCEKDNAFPDQAVSPAQNAVSSEMIIDVSNKADDVISDQMATAVHNALNESIERDDKNDDHGLSDINRITNSSKQSEINEAGDNKKDGDHSGQDSDSILKQSNDQRDKDKEDFFPPEKSEIQKESKNVNQDEKIPNATTHENVTNESVSESHSQSHSTLPPTSVISKQAVQSSVDSSYLSDSSEGGGLVIDYDSEQDLNKSSEGPPGEVKVESSKSTQRPHDVTDLISDSSFMTKDIVLGFENELGADTVFSTLSHGDMEDLFLLEDGEEDSEIGMIPDEEVEKLLGLDMAGEGEFGNSGSKQQKTDLSKTSSSSFTTSEKSDSTALQWVSLSEKNRSETKARVDLNENRKTPCSEDSINHRNGGSETVKSLKDNSSNMSKSESENRSQVQEKKNQISPSWNRLLGSEALKKMKNDMSVSSSHPPSSQHDKSSQSTGQMKLKFCAGALSKALKLSAEMKKVFADGPSQNNSAQKGITISKDAKLIQKMQSKQCPKALTETSTSAVKTETREEHFPDGNEKHSGDSLQTAGYSSTVKLRNSIQETLQFDLKQQSYSNLPVLPSVKHEVENINKDLEENYNANTDHMGNNHITVTDKNNQAVQRETRSRSKSNRGACKTNRKNLNKGPEMSHLDSSHLSNALQSSSEVPSAEENTKVSESKSKSTVSTTGAKGIDLNKLKLKLNPLLFANKKILSTVSRVKSGDIPAPSPIPGKEVRLRSRALNIERREQGAMDSPEPGLALDANQWSAEKTPKRKNESIVETPSHLDKQKIDSEPVLNTAKLCNILKKLKKSSSGFKVSETTDSSSSSGVSVHGKISSTDQIHSTAKSDRRLRSSPCAGHSEKSEKDMETVGSSELRTKAPQREDQSMVGKAEDEDRVERSFIDCLSGVISGAWENA